MVRHITNVIKEYQDRLYETPYVPKTSYRRDSLGYCGDVNKNFLTFLFSDQATVTQFLKDVGLIRSKVQCNSCGRDMTCYADPNIPGGFRWRCRRMVAGTRCFRSRSIRHGSWFQEGLYLTYHILRRESAKDIQHEHHFSDHTIADWGMFCREAMLVYLEGCSEKIGGPNKTVEIDDSNFGLRKYYRGHPVKGQCVFGGVERESGRTFLVLILDRTANALTNVIHAWIEAGTTLISDCWAAYRDIGSHGYTPRTINHNICFVNPDARDHTNIIECTWRHVKACLGPHHRREDYEFHLAHYMFATRCEAQGVSQFSRLLAIATSTDWSSCTTPATSGWHISISYMLSAMGGGAIPQNQ